MANRDILLIDVTNNSPEHIYENDDDQADLDELNNDDATYSRFYEQIDGGDSTAPNSPEYQILISSTQSNRDLLPTEKIILDTIDQCFRHWYKPWRETFLKGGREFKILFDLMEDLLYYESQIKNSETTLPSERTNKIAQAVARLIDCGHAILNLDLIIRNNDETSSEIEPNSVTTMALFKAHVEAHKFREKLLYDYFKKDKRTHGCPTGNEGGISDGMLSIMPTSPASFSSTTLQIPNSRSLRRSHSPSISERTHKLSISSDKSISMISDGNKSPSNLVQPAQIELQAPADVQSQMDVSHLTAAIRGRAFSDDHDNVSRLTLLRGVLEKIDTLLKPGSTVESLTNCFELLDSLFDSIDKLQPESRHQVVTLVFEKLLKPIVEKISIGEEIVEFQLAHLTSHLLSMIGWMKDTDFYTYLGRINDRANIASFLTSYLFIAKRLTAFKGDETAKSNRTNRIDLHHRSSSQISNETQNPTFPNCWIEMKLVASERLLNSLTYIYETLKKLFDVKTTIWFSFIDCLTCFIQQECLQPGRFMLKEEQKFTAEILRQTAADYLLNAWMSLKRSQKAELLHTLIQPILHTCLILEPSKSLALIPILQNMMECDYVGQYCGSSNSTLSSQSSSIAQAPSLIQVDSSGQQRSLSEEIGSNDDEIVITNFTHLMIDKLNFLLIDKSLGDETFKDELCMSLVKKNDVFDEISKHPEKLRPYKDMAQLASNLISEFIQICLDFKLAVSCSYKHLHLLCLFKLISFLRDKVKRPELQLSYLYKLCMLHLKMNRKIEAGFTLLEHAETLSSEPGHDLKSYHAKSLKESFEVQGINQLTDQLSLKIVLYNMVIDWFVEAELWNAAVPLCQELLNIYQNKTFELEKVVEVLGKMSDLYRNIIDIGQQNQPEYFRVKFYGLGFPKSIRNVTMIYRGDSCIKLGDFQATILSEYADAKLLNTLGEPDPSLLIEPGSKYLQINACSPVPDLQAKFGPDLSKIPETSLFYYKHNNCDKFWFDRRIIGVQGTHSLRTGRRLNSISSRHSGSDECNEFANLWRERTTLTTNTLPGMLPFFQVFLVETSRLCPIECAIDDIQTLYDRLSSKVNRLRADKRHLEDTRSLWQIIQGVVDPAVNGGIAKYEKAFLTPDPDRLSVPGADHFTESIGTSSSPNRLSTGSPSPQGRVMGSFEDQRRISVITGREFASARSPIQHNSPTYEQVDEREEEQRRLEKAYDLKKDQLKRLIARLVPILDEAIKLHGERVAENMRPQQDYLESAFKKLRDHVISDYSKYLPTDYLRSVRSNRSRARSPSRSMRISTISGDSCSFSSNVTGRMGFSNRVSTNSDARSMSTRVSSPSHQAHFRRISTGFSASNTSSDAVVSGSNFPYHQLNEKDATSDGTTAIASRLLQLNKLSNDSLVRDDRRRSTPEYRSNNLRPSASVQPQTQNPVPSPRSWLPQPQHRNVQIGNIDYNPIEGKPLTIRVSPKQAYKQVICDNGPLNLSNRDVCFDGTRHVTIQNRNMSPTNTASQNDQEPDSSDRFGSNGDANLVSF